MKIVIDRQMSFSYVCVQIGLLHGIDRVQLISMSSRMTIRTVMIISTNLDLWPIFVQKFSFGDVPCVKTNQAVFYPRLIFDWYLLNRL